MEIKIVKDAITISELMSLAQNQFGNVIKAVIDTEQEIMGVGGEFHSEIEALLIEKEKSERNNTWGVNLILDEAGDNFVEFDSMINLKPLLGNKTRDVENQATRIRIRNVVKKLVHA